MDCSLLVFVYGHLAVTKVLISTEWFRLFYEMKIRLLLLFLSFATTIYAESIIIKQKSGNETVLELSTNPVITFADESMIVTNDFTTITFPLDDIDSYVVGETSGIQEMKDSPQFRDGHVVFKGIKEKSSVTAYSLDGKTIRKYAPDNSGVIDVNLRSLPKGAFVISTPNNKVKIINK